VNRVQVLSPAFPLDVAHVVDRLRPEDVAEAMAFGLDPVRGPWVTYQYAYDSFVASVDGEPAFVFGTVQLLPGVRQVFGFGTAKTGKAIPAITRFCKDTWAARLINDGVRRVQVMVPQSSGRSLKWLTAGGFKIECTMEGYAIDGSPMVQLVYSKDDLIKCALTQGLVARL